MNFIYTIPTHDLEHRVGVSVIYKTAYDLNNPWIMCIKRETTVDHMFFTVNICFIYQIHLTKL